MIGRKIRMRRAPLTPTVRETMQVQRYFRRQLGPCSDIDGSTSGSESLVPAARCMKPCSPCFSEPRLILCCSRVTWTDKVTIRPAFSHCDHSTLDVLAASRTCRGRQHGRLRLFSRRSERSCEHGARRTFGRLTTCPTLTPEITVII